MINQKQEFYVLGVPELVKSRNDSAHYLDKHRLYRIRVLGYLRGKWIKEVWFNSDRCLRGMVIFLRTEEYVLNKQDIIKSMERIEWCKDYTDDPNFYSAYIGHCYTYIDQLKNELPQERWFDIQYESLVHDPLFVKDRSNFTVKQHLLDKPNGPKTWRNDGYIRTVKE